jgi:2-polyprenyl-6-methoxyphenol hydroxylase-like FAD-dependent oxidoreductase
MTDRVLIVGGGIAGLCLAQALHQAQLPVVVCERDRDRTARLEGYRIHINPAGSRALHACLPAAVWRRFVSSSGASASLGFYTERLRELLVTRDENGRPGTPEQERSFAADRVTLRGLLLDGLDDVAQFGRTFTHYQVDGETVTAFFDDGSHASGNVLIGADGANSRVRRQYLPQAQRVESEGLGIACRLPLTDERRAWLPPRFAHAMNQVVAASPSFLFTSAFEPDQASRPAYVLCAFSARRDLYPPEIDRLDQESLKLVLETMIADWHPTLRRLIAESDPDSFMLVHYLSSRRVPDWPTSRVTLIGDAIHSMPPTGGMGGNAALRDAHLLARQLVPALRGSGTPLIPAIHAYETDMRDYGFAAVDITLRVQGQGLERRPIAVAGQRLWFALSRGIPALARLSVPYAEWARPRPWERQPVPWAPDQRASPAPRRSRAA